MNIQIVYPNDGWILKRYGDEILKYYPGYKGMTMEPDLEQEWDVTYFINYALYKPVPKSKLVGAYFTHREGQSFELIAFNCDFCVSMSDKYAEFLKEHNDRVFKIWPGVDLDMFRPKMRIGIMGRHYGSGRKGEDWIERLKEIDFLEVVHAKGQFRYEDMPMFYNLCDYILILSRIEGGPMSIVEGLACGKEIISSDVGMAKEFKNVRIYDRDNFDSLKNILVELGKKRALIRAEVMKTSWKDFADGHHKLFGELLNEKAGKD